MTARDDALRADLRTLADEWECMATVLSHPTEDEATRSRGVGLAFCVTKLRDLLDAHEPATEPEAPQAIREAGAR